MVCFPHGIYYGRVDEKALGKILQSYSRRQLFLDNYRGRACYPKSAQAAEYYLRKNTNNQYLSSYRLIDIQPLEDGQEAVLFSNNDGGGYHRLHLQPRQSNFILKKSCGDDQLVPVGQYDLTGYSTFETLDLWILISPIG